MKKIVSIIIAAVMAFCLCLPAFAAQSATFAVNVVSESDTRAIVSIDYEGGAAFNCLDFEVKLSKRLSVEKCATGAGLRNFKIYADDLNANLGDTVIMSFNKDSNPIKFTFASISGFKAVNGKDLLTLTLKKTSADKLKADDVKLTVTNCGICGRFGRHNGCQDKRHIKSRGNNLCYHNGRKLRAQRRVNHARCRIGIGQERRE